ncbi:hypothetical protein Esti_006612 [Eimeria stiedai]
MGGPFASNASAASAAAVAAATTGAAAAAAATPHRSPRAPPLRLYLTGFGPFGDIRENPSSELVEALARALKGSNCSCRSADSSGETAAASPQQPPADHLGGPPLQHLSCLDLCGFEVLQVSAEAANEAATRIHRLLRADAHQATRGPPLTATAGPSLPVEGPPLPAEGASSPAEKRAPLRGEGGPFPAEGTPLSAVGAPQCLPAAAAAAARGEAEALSLRGSKEERACSEEASKPLCLAIHFGVNAKSSVWMLEKAAKNDAQFPCKDTRGYVPKSREICCSLPFEARLRCGLPLEDVAAALQQQGHPCSTSEDAGCFVCNYLYFRSLQEAKSSGGTALFVHVSSWRFAAAASLMLQQQQEALWSSSSSSKLYGAATAGLGLLLMLRHEASLYLLSFPFTRMHCCLSLLLQCLLLGVSLSVSPLPQVPLFSVMPLERQLAAALSLIECLAADCIGSRA